MDVATHPPEEWTPSGPTVLFPEARQVRRRRWLKGLAIAVAAVAVVVGIAILAAESGASNGAAAGSGHRSSAPVASLSAVKTPRDFGPGLMPDVLGSLEPTAISVIEQTSGYAASQITVQQLTSSEVASRNLGAFPSGLVVAQIPAIDSTLTSNSTIILRVVS